ncbi:hypothetical protein Tsubulata_041943, partial [Turnera subulata]
TGGTGSSAKYMQRYRAPAGLRNCISSLQRCALHKNLQQGRLLHSHLLVTGLHSSSPLCTTSLINMYAKCSQLSQAALVFNHTPSHSRNVFVYNAMISGFVSNGLARAGLGAYTEMRRGGVLPDKYTIPCLIKGLCDIMEVSEVKKIHALVLKLGLELDMHVGSALVSSYLKFELLDEAHDVFDEMPERDVVLWNSMVNGYAQTGCFDEAVLFFRQMVKEGVLISSFTFTKLKGKWGLQLFEFIFSGWPALCLWFDKMFDPAGSSDDRSLVQAQDTKSSSIRRKKLGTSSAN